MQTHPRFARRGQSHAAEERHRVADDHHVAATPFRQSALAESGRNDAAATPPVEHADRRWARLRRRRRRDPRVSGEDGHEDNGQPAGNARTQAHAPRGPKIMWVFVCTGVYAQPKKKPRFIPPSNRYCAHICFVTFETLWTRFVFASIAESDPVQNASKPSYIFSWFPSEPSSEAIPNERRIRRRAVERFAWI